MNINYKLLRKQINYLLSLPPNENVEGSISLLDSIQDNAVDVEGLSEEEVFDL